MINAKDISGTSPGRANVELALFRAESLRQQGAVARMLGRSPMDNPHRRGTWEWLQWDIGYQRFQ